MCVACNVRFALVFFFSFRSSLLFFITFLSAFFYYTLAGPLLSCLALPSFYHGVLRPTFSIPASLFYCWVPSSCLFQFPFFFSIWFVAGSLDFFLHLLEFLSSFFPASLPLFQKSYIFFPLLLSSICSLLFHSPFQTFRTFLRFLSFSVRFLSLDILVFSLVK